MFKYIYVLPFSLITLTFRLKSTFFYEFEIPNISKFLDSTKNLVQNTIFSSLKLLDVSSPFSSCYELPMIQRRHDNGKESTVNRALGGSTYPG